MSSELQSIAFSPGTIFPQQTGRDTHLSELNTTSHNSDPSDPISVSCAQDVEAPEAPAPTIAPAPAAAAAAATAELKVTFFPPLHAERCAWIISILRRERVTSVLDVGCGTGDLLCCLCNPTAFLGEPGPEGVVGEHEYDELMSESSTEPSRGAFAKDDLPDLHLARLAGLDASRPAIERCIELTKQRTDCLGLLRWEDLEVKLWHGSLDVFNAEFVGTDCIVSSEVIEHLPPPVLSVFARTLLGTYRPRLLLLTTPNYTFNARFSPPGVADPWGHPDPTRRTDRVFRHHDHKFEWTVAEFTAWCVGEASAWEYTVKVSGVGIPMEDDPWGRDGQLGYATQVAIFRRRDDWPGLEIPLEPRLGSESEKGAHTLVGINTHAAHPQARKPRPSSAIQDLVIQHMGSYYLEAGYTIWDLWMIDEISAACGGYLDILFRAIESSSELSLEGLADVARTEWTVKFSGDRHHEAVEMRKKEQLGSLRSQPSDEEGDSRSRIDYTWPQTPYDLAEDMANIDISDSWGRLQGWGADYTGWGD
ncbi:hypothetical protein M0805_004913 [Coniferiporia weirii]|nr:hypothetical protein M0805_004913 [Coniferiporia weirii]